MKILIVTDNRYWREQIGSQRRIASLCNFFHNHGYEIEVLFSGYLYPPDTRKISEHPLPYLMTAEGTRDIGVKTESTSLNVYGYLRHLKNIVRQTSIEFRRFVHYRKSDKYYVFRNFFLQIHEPKVIDYHNESLLIRFRTVCKQFSPQIILIEYVRLAWLLDAAADTLPNSCLKLIDTHDVQYERQSRFHAQGEIHDIDITPNEEAAALSLGDIVLAIQSSDASKFRELVPDKCVITVGFPCEIYQHAPRISDSISIGFFGSAMMPNVHAVDRLLDKIFAPLRQRYGERIDLHIYGDICTNINQSRIGQGVQFHGFVNDLALAYEGLDIIVNPVDFGGGLKIKNVEALCHGRPLVTTSIGAEGLESGINEAFLIATDDNDFINKIDLLVCDDNTRKTLGESASKFANQNFSQSAVFLELNKILNSFKIKTEIGLENCGHNMTIDSKS